jgi:CheY-like chemotaxis protein
VNLLILVVDDEPDVEVLFRQQFRHDLRAGRFTIEFAQAGPMALQRITDASDRSLILILSDINMPGMSDVEGLVTVLQSPAFRLRVTIGGDHDDGDVRSQCFRLGQEFTARSKATGPTCGSTPLLGWALPPRRPRNRSRSGPARSLWPIIPIIVR